MQSRKIQLIAGTTYSISLPKDWVKKNKLKEKDEVIINEKNDRTLVISPHSIKIKDLREITLDIDEYQTNIDRVLFAVYYIGIEKIKLYSKKELTKEVRARIRSALENMSGTEISYEDKQHITIRVLLDKTKVDVIQTLYRLNLIIDSTISNLQENLDINETRVNEAEVDRLYHLISKIISLTLIDSEILHTSNIKNISLVPSFFLISKRIENISDRFHRICENICKYKIEFKHKKEILDFFRKELNRSINHICKRSEKSFAKATMSEEEKVLKSTDNMDEKIRPHIRTAVRLLLDVEDEIVNISFYNQLIKKGIL